MTDQLPRERVDLLRKLEPLMAVCYNPHSTRAEFVGPDDWDIAEVGREFRYPVTYGEPNNLRKAHYKFGANEMYVFENLNKVLDYLAEHPAALIRRPQWILGFHPAGIRVGRVLRNRPAWSSRLRPNDLIVGVNDVEVRDMSELEALRDEVSAGGKLFITVLRRGARRRLTVYRPNKKPPRGVGKKR
jgi:hypothetical protein